MHQPSAKQVLAHDELVSTGRLIEVCDVAAADCTKNDDGSDGALATTLGYGAIAAAALLA